MLTNQHTHNGNDGTVAAPSRIADGPVSGLRDDLNKLRATVYSIRTQTIPTVQRQRFETFAKLK